VSGHRRDWLVGSLIVIVMFLLIILMVNRGSGGMGLEDVSFSIKGDKIAVVELKGPIYDSHSIVRQFKRYGGQRSIKAILFRIDSPGGGISPSQEIYEAVRRVRDTGKPVVASMGEVAASGGFYVAMGADTIVANPGTTTGSIGVILEITNLRKLFEKIGIKFDVIKSGKFKDTGAYHRDLTSQDRQYLQEYVNDAYEQFVEVVVRERNMKKSDLLKLADGRVFTGRQANQLGLIDVVGDFEDAVKLAAQMAKIEGEPTLVRETEKRRNVYDLFFEEVSRVIRGTGASQLEYRLTY
jgi:protease-4